MEAFEYHIIDLRLPIDVDIVNELQLKLKELGAQGWELTHVICFQYSVLHYLKRSLE